MEPYTWNSFTRRININAPVSSIYEMWSTPVGIEKWFLRQCKITGENGETKTGNDPFSMGDKYLWRWHGWSDDVQEKGTILEANGKDEVKFTFGQSGGQDMVCTIKIYLEDGETICELKQEHIAEDERSKTVYHVGCLTGWVFYLANLKSILEGGVDLRNKNECLKNMLNS